MIEFVCKPSQQIVIGEDIKLIFLNVVDSEVSLGIAATKDILIMRSELLSKNKRLYRRKTKGNYE